MIDDYKITSSEINQTHVQSAPDVLSSDAQDNKQIFDNLVEYFIGKYNDLIDHIKANYISIDEVGAGLTHDTDLEWTHALHKEDVTFASYSGTITEVDTGGYRTLIGAQSIHTYMMNDCVVNINGTDYQCGDAAQSGDIVTTTCVVNDVIITFTLNVTTHELVMSHTTNPLDTLYWQVQLYPTTAEKIPSKSLPASVTNDGYTELDYKIDDGYAELNNKINDDYAELDDKIDDECDELNNLIEELQSRVIVIEKEETYSAHDSHGITINSSELQGLGVDDLDNYSIISFRWRFGIGGWKYTGATSQNDSVTVYPIVTSSTNITIQPHNSTSSSVIFSCRLVLMKVK